MMKTLLELCKELDPDEEYLKFQDGYYYLDNIDDIIGDITYLSPILKITCYEDLNDDIYDTGVEEYYLTKEQLEFLNKIKVNFGEEAFDFSFFARRPYYRIRGKSVTEEQAFNILKKTDDIVPLAYNKMERTDVIANQCYMFNILTNSWFDTSSPLPPFRGWVQPDGLVGCNAISGLKNPTGDYLIEDLVYLKREFPYLDMVIAFSVWDEAPREYLENFKPGQKRRTKEYEGFTDNIELGVWLHDEYIEILSAEQAKIKYEQYDNLYKTEHNERFLIGYYVRYNNGISEPELLRKLLLSFDGAPVDLIDAYVERFKDIVTEK